MNTQETKNHLFNCLGHLTEIKKSAINIGKNMMAFQGINDDAYYDIIEEINVINVNEQIIREIIDEVSYRIKCFNEE